MIAKSHSLPRREIRRGKPGLFRRFLEAQAVWRQKRRLEELEPHLLKDIGLTQEDVRKAHGTKWDAPGHWLR